VKLRWKTPLITVLVMVGLHAGYWGGMAWFYHELYQKRVEKGGLESASLALSGYPLGWKWTWQQPFYTDQALTIKSDGLRLEINLWQPFTWQATSLGPVTLTGTSAIVTLAKARVNSTWRRDFNVEAEDGVVRLTTEGNRLGDIHFDHNRMAWRTVETGITLDSVIEKITLADDAAVNKQQIDNILINGLVTGPNPFHTTPAEWQKQNGRFDLRQLSLNSGAMKVDGTGMLGLSPDLHPDGNVTLILRGWPQMLDQAVAAGRLEPFQAKMMSLGFSLFSSKDKDGNPVVECPVVLKEGRLKIAGIPMATLPTFTPDLRQ